MSHAEAGASPESLPAPPLPAPPPPPPLLSPIAMASPLRVEVTFEYAFDELREGLTQTPDFKPRKKVNWFASLFGWVLFIGLAVVLFLLLNRTAPAAAGAGTLYPERPGVDITIALAPSLFAAAFVGIFAMMVAVTLVAQTSKNKRLRRANKYIVLVAIISYALLIWAGLSTFTSASRTMWQISRTQTLLLSLMPWIVVLIAIVAFAMWLSRNHFRRLWNSKPYLRRRRTIILDADGERSADGVSEMFYRWIYFSRAWETPNCLVLQDENQLRHVLPKRVMDQPTLDQAKAVISNHIADCKFLTPPGGFPVAMPAAAIPAPATAPPPA